jgi:membrane protein YqaA with SNARE-associated domain
VLLSSCLVAAGILGLASIVFLALPGPSPELKTWAAATLSSIVSGVVSYSLGRAGKPT